MAIENEIKYLLRPSAFPDAALMAGGDVTEIEQHYLAPGTRVRMLRNSAGSEFVFTFKRATSEGLVEIETAISERDFDLVRATATSSIVKKRVSFEEGALKWDIDLFHTDAGGFVFAEVEMPEGMEKPAYVPHFVGVHLVRELGTDPDFSNQSISQPGRLAQIAQLVQS